MPELAGRQWGENFSGVQPLPRLAAEASRLHSGRIMSELIAQAELKSWMKKVPEWELEEKLIVRQFEFDDFTAAIDFVNAVAEIAEELDHHPDIDVRWNKVKLALATHSKGGLTPFDFETAERIDTLED